MRLGKKLPPVHTHTSLVILLIFRAAPAQETLQRYRGKAYRLQSILPQMSKDRAESCSFHTDYRVNHDGAGCFSA